MNRPMDSTPLDPELHNTLLNSHTWSALLSSLSFGIVLDTSQTDFTSYLNDISLVDAALQEAHTTFRNAFKDITRLRRHRNALQPACSLPSEILTEIFRYCPRKRENLQDNCYAYSQVCFRWRAVAVADPFLWTCPDFYRPSLAKVMYEDRAPHNLLHIHYPGPTPSLGFSRLPSPLNHRARSIHISSFTVSIAERRAEEDCIYDYLEGDFPVTESLHLQCANQGASVKPLPLVLRAPFLRSLTLCNWHPQWSSEWLSSLTSLTVSMTAPLYQLDGHPQLQDFRPRVDAQEPLCISGALNRAVNLRSLKLENVMSMGRLLPPDDDVEPLQLVRLQDLHIRDNINLLDPLLYSLHVPSAKSINIQINMAEEEDSTMVMEDLGTSLQQFFAANRWTQMDEMWMFVSPIMRTEFVHASSTHGQSNFTFNFCNTLNSQEVCTWMDVIATSFPITNLSTARLNLERAETLDCDGLTLLYTLKLSTSLDYLHVLGNDSDSRFMERLLAALEPIGRPHDHNAQPFPALEVLDLWNLPMERRIRPSSARGQMESAYSKLVGILERRRDAGVPLLSVFLEECSFDIPLDDLRANRPSIVEFTEPLFIEADWDV